MVKNCNLVDNLNSLKNEIQWKIVIQSKIPITPEIEIQSKIPIKPEIEIQSKILIKSEIEIHPKESYSKIQLNAMKA